MNLDHLRDYLIMSEIAVRWKATDPEMCRAALKGLLKPSLYLNACLRPVVVSQAGSIEAVPDADTEQVVGWHYLTPIQQVGALDCTASTVAVVSVTLPGTSMWALDKPLSMREVMAEAVVMAEDLAQAEAVMEEQTHWQQRSGKTKEFNSVLNVLSIVLADCYRYDPRGRSATAREIAEAGERFGIPVSANTVAKWIKQATSEFAPSYVLEPLRTPAAEGASAEMN
jgi:hypothetical protein